MGQSGGIWPLWRSSVGEIEIIESSSQFVFARLQNGEEKLNLIVVYAAPSASRRSGLWDKLRAIIQGMDGPVIIGGGGGEYNTIVCLDERTGGNGSLSQDSLEFGDWINSTSLIDMGFSGNKFTWR